MNVLEDSDGDEPPSLVDTQQAGQKNPGGTVEDRQSSSHPEPAKKVPITIVTGLKWSEE